MSMRVSTADREGLANEAAMPSHGLVEAASRTAHPSGA